MSNYFFYIVNIFNAIYFNFLRVLVQEFLKLRFHFLHEAADGGL
jgi:hypothetical protein